MLKVENLTIKFESETVVNDITFNIEEGEILGIVGESGSGKTMTALSIAGLLPKEAALSGSIEFGGKDLVSMPEKERRKYKGKEIGMVFQEPMTSLNPVLKIRKQLEEILILHFHYSKEERFEKMIEALRVVELPEPEKLLSKYPHELSGGMQQRVMIAMALLGEPKLIIADEPTTALDIDVQKQILQLMSKINKEKHTSFLFISHDLNVIKEICDRVIVMYKGDNVETGATQEVFYNPKHDYTKKLIASIVNGTKQAAVNENKSILEVKDVNIYYMEKPDTMFARKQKHTIIKNFNLDIKEGEIVGIVGRSGIGKTSLCKSILGLHKDYEGEIIHHSKMPQMVFQDTYSSLNPAKKIGWILEEPLRIQKQSVVDERKAQVKEMLEKVGMGEEFSDRYPDELSGGQRQRVSIALALMLKSRFIIADEPVSALDVTTQTQILELLLQLQKEFKLSILFISHDINVVNKVCDRIITITSE